MKCRNCSCEYEVQKGEYGIGFSAGEAKIYTKCPWCDSENMKMVQKTKKKGANNENEDN